MKGLLVIISGPSGSGKTTIVQEVVARMQDRYPITRVVTYTTRAMRPGEKPGVDYHWITEADFKQKIEEGFFLEWSTAYGAYYGTPRTILDDLAQGMIDILTIDRVGARLIKEKIPDAMTIWLTAPSQEELRKRLINRAKNTPEDIEKRLQIGQKEMEDEKKCKFYAFFLVNSLKEGTIITVENEIVKNYQKLHPELVSNRLK
jgi:guanylate kinase